MTWREEGRCGHVTWREVVICEYYREEVWSCEY